MKKFLLIIYIALVNFVPASSQADYDIQQYSTANGLPSNLTACMEQDRNGLLWFGTWRGLCCFDGYDFLSFDNTTNPDQSPLCTRIHALKPDANDNIWLVTYDRRAYRFDTHNCQYTDISETISQQLGIGNTRIRNIYAMDNGAVWLTCYDEEDHAFRCTPKEITDEYGRLPENCQNLRKVVQDNEGNEWLETGDGAIFLWQPGNHQLKAVKGTKALQAKAVLDAYTTVLSPKVQNLDLADDTKRFIDRQNNVWTLGSNLVRYTPQRSLLRPETPEYIKKRITRQKPSKLYAQLTDSKGRQWQGFKGGGLTLNGKPFNDGLQGKDVFDIFEDSHHHVWVACYDGGFNLFDESTKRFISHLQFKNYPTERHEKVRHITETHDGIIILSTAYGIVCFSSDFKKSEGIQFHAYTTSRDKGSIPGGNVMQVLEATDGKIYISTMTGGLTVVTSGHPLKDNLQFAPVEGTKQNNGIVLAFIEDDNKCLWLARENNLECFDMKTGKTTLFGSKNFGGDVTFSEALPVKDPETGEITMGLNNGTLTFNPKEMVLSSFTPHILFSSVQFQGSQERLPILNADELDVPSDKRNLTIYFSALDYQDNELVQYAYKIVNNPDNTDNLNDIETSDWNYVGHSHCASFNNLPCGRLKLLVRSTNADGVWTDNIAVLNIYSHPTFWETPWAWLLYTAIVLAIVFVAVYIVLMRQRHQREREEMERKLEALLQTLNSKETDKQAAQESNRDTFALPEVQIEPEEKKMMERLMAYLDQNIGNSDLKIGEIADALGMSRSVFYDRIKNITGMSPVDFVRYLRIQRAKQMMLSSDLSISQIAYEVGFSDPNYFSKTFKKAIGKSPSEFRKESGLAPI